MSTPLMPGPSLAGSDLRLAASVIRPRSAGTLVQHLRAANRRKSAGTFMAHLRAGRTQAEPAVPFSPEEQEAHRHGRHPRRDPAQHLVAPAVLAGGGKKLVERDVDHDPGHAREDEAHDARG